MRLISAVVLFGCMFLVGILKLHAQQRFLEISPRVMHTNLYAQGTQARSGIKPMLAVYIYPGTHFGIGFFGAAFKNYTTTGIEFIATSNRNSRITCYGLTSVYFLESNLPSSYGTDISTIGLGFAIGAGITIMINRWMAINLLEANYQNNLLAEGHLFSSDSNPAKHAITFEGGLLFRVIKRN